MRGVTVSLPADLRQSVFKCRSRSPGLRRRTPALLCDSSAPYVLLSSILPDFCGSASAAQQLKAGVSAIKKPVGAARPACEVQQENLPFLANDVEPTTTHQMQQMTHGGNDTITAKEVEAENKDSEATDALLDAVSAIEISNVELLSLERLVALRDECRATDVVIEVNRMGRWTENQVRKFFIEGVAPGLVDADERHASSPAQAPATPHSPEPELIRDENDVPTPKTVEFHLEPEA